MLSSFLLALAAGGIGIAAASPAGAQASGCSSISDRNARLECYDRSQRSAGPSQGHAAPRQEGCTRTSPCTGPRGGVYYITPSGNKRYLPR